MASIGNDSDFGFDVDDDFGFGRDEEEEEWIVPRIMHLFGIWSHFISFSLHLHFICISHSPQN